MDLCFTSVLAESLYEDAIFLQKSSLERIVSGDEYFLKVDFIIIIIINEVLSVHALMKILPVNRFKDPKAAVLILKMLTGSHL
jgi:hypothetical protein